jgi:hypothetical protein
LKSSGYRKTRTKPEKKLRATLNKETRHRRAPAVVRGPLALPPPPNVICVAVV